MGRKRKAIEETAEQSNVELTPVVVKEKRPIPQKVSFLIFRIQFYLFQIATLKRSEQLMGYMGGLETEVERNLLLGGK
jgi:hypothetical protein